MHAKKSAATFSSLSEGYLKDRTRQMKRNPEHWVKSCFSQSALKSDCWLLIEIETEHWKKQKQKQHTSCPVAVFIPKRPLTPPFPTNGWVSSHNTQYTAPTHHTRHSTCLYYYLRVSNVSSPTNNFLHVSKLVRVATAFDIRRRFMGGGDPPNKNKKTTFSLHTGAAPSSEKMWTI